MYAQFNVLCPGGLDFNLVSTRFLDTLDLTTFEITTYFPFNMNDKFANLFAFLFTGMLVFEQISLICHCLS